MKFIGSDIGVSDAININEIDYASIPGPSFTPGIGGTYKQDPPPYGPAKEEIAQWDQIKKSPGCEHTQTAGYRTMSYCTPKTATCPLERRWLPTQNFSPGKLDYLMADVMAKKEQIKTTRETTGIALLVAFLFYIYFVGGCGLDSIRRK